MIESKRYELVFLEEAKKEYKKLDGSVKKLVNVALKKLEVRADTLGEELSNMNGIHLAGCRKIKFKQAGIRIVYRIVNGRTEIVEIITIGKRDDLEVYRIAAKRL